MHKRYYGSARSLFAYAAQVSLEVGFLVFKAKTSELLDYYAQVFGSRRVAAYDPFRMIIWEDTVERIIVEFRRDEMSREELLRAEDIGSEQGWVVSLTHELTHNRKRAGGGNGMESTGVFVFPEQKGPESAGKRHSEGRESVGKDEVPSSNLDSSSIKSAVFCWK